MGEPLDWSEGRDGPGDPSEPEIDAFALALSGLEEDTALAALLVRGPAAWLRRKVFTPAARRLGVWWEEDRVCFATVTLAMSHLQRLAWTHGRAFAHDSPLRPAMVLSTMPGEQHTFGVNLLMEEMRHRGVEPTALPCPSRETLIAAAASGRFAVIGLSAGSGQRLQEVSTLAQALRRASPGRVRIVMGGPAVESESLTLTGVDEILSGDLAITRLCTLAAQTNFQRAVAA